MNRLHTELQRLYLPPDAQQPGTDSASLSLRVLNGRVRAMVLELARPAEWSRVAAVWQGVQEDLDLPAPAIAVSGTDAYQLWFSLSEPVTVQQAHDFLEALRKRYWADLVPERLRAWPSMVEAPSTTPLQMVPAQQGAQGHWSAFVAPGLAALMEDEPWLDLPPSPDAQADLLCRLVPISPDQWHQALGSLSGGSAAEFVATPSVAAPLHRGEEESDPGRFLLRVMNDAGVAMPLRIEAAKALLSVQVPAAKA